MLNVKSRKKRDRGRYSVNPTLKNKRDREKYYSNPTLVNTPFTKSHTWYVIGHGSTDQKDVFIPPKIGTFYNKPKLFFKGLYNCVTRLCPLMDDLSTIYQLCIIKDLLDPTNIVEFLNQNEVNYKTSKLRPDIYTWTHEVTERNDHILNCAPTLPVLYNQINVELGQEHLWGPDTKIFHIDFNNNRVDNGTIDIALQAQNKHSVLNILWQYLLSPFGIYDINSIKSSEGKVGQILTAIKHPSTQKFCNFDPKTGIATQTDDDILHMFQTMFTFQNEYNKLEDVIQRLNKTYQDLVTKYGMEGFTELDNRYQTIQITTLEGSWKLKFWPNLQLRISDLVFYDMINKRQPPNIVWNICRVIPHLTRTMPHPTTGIMTTALHNTLQAPGTFEGDPGGFMTIAPPTLAQQFQTNALQPLAPQDYHQQSNPNLSPKTVNNLRTELKSKLPFHNKRSLRDIVHQTRKQTRWDLFKGKRVGGIKRNKHTRIKRRKPRIKRRKPQIKRRKSIKSLRVGGGIKRHRNPRRKKSRSNRSRPKQRR